MVVVTAYLDESGTHNSSDNVAVAGFLATDERWGAFEEKWQKALDDYELNMFRMSAFANGAPPFDGDDWTEEYRQTCLNRFIDAISLTLPQSIGMVVPRVHFDALLSDDVKKYLGGPYGLAANQVIATLGETLGPLNRDLWIAYVFEQGARGAGEILRVFQENMRIASVRDHHRISSIAFQDKRLFLPLQAADMLAYEMYRHWPRLETGERERYPLGRFREFAHIWSWVNPILMLEVNESVKRVIRDA